MSQLGQAKCATLVAKISDAAKSSTVEVQGSGSPVMMIPGLMSDRRVWQDTASELSY